MKCDWTWSRPFAVVAFYLAVGVGQITAQADDIAEKGRSILEKHRNAVITIELVLKQKMAFPGMPSRANETKAEATGTVIDATGLTVMSLSISDPTSLLETMFGGMDGMRGLEMDTEVSDVKMLLSDGTEIPAEIVLRDKDLDMAFVRPEEKQEKAFEFIDLSSGASPEILDRVISINRLGRVAARVHSVSIERVDAIVKKPRTFYIPGKDATNTNVGSPAFTVEGEAIGVFLIRAIRNTGGSSGGFFSGMDDNVITVILPGEDVLDAASQAPPYKD